VKAAARCLIRSRLVATEPQWPRMNSTFSRSLRTRHSPVIPEISLGALRLLRFRPSSLPRFAASDDGHFAPSELPARPQEACHAAREITVAVPNTSMQMHQGTVGSKGGAKLFQWNICRRQRWSSMLFIDLFGFTAPRRSIITL